MNSLAVAVPALHDLSRAVLDADDKLMALGYRLDLINNVFAGCDAPPTDDAVSFSLSAITTDLKRIRDDLDAARAAALASVHEVCKAEGEVSP